MKRLIPVLAALGCLAMAQDIPVLNQLGIKTFGFMGKVVKGAPYSADEVTESLQVLADGTQITRKTQVTVYRDGEGRVRRESPTEITIIDPVAGVNYTLDPKTMTAVKSSTGAFRVYFDYSDSKVLDPAAAADTVKAKAQLDKLQAEMAASMSNTVIVNDRAASDKTSDTVKVQLDQVAAKLAAAGRAVPVTENLGQQVIEGLSAEGTRSTTTLEAGAIGNDRPIHTVSERWYSADLQTVVMTKHSDPRSGDETFRLTNVRRGEPGADLFLLPPGYQLVPSAVQFAPKKVVKEQ